MLQFVCDFELIVQQNKDWNSVNQKFQSEAISFELIVQQNKDWNTYHMSGGNDPCSLN